MRNINNGLNGFPAAENINNGLNGYYFQGVHLSQVHQPSKKYTNQSRSAPVEQEDGLIGFTADAFFNNGLSGLNGFTADIF